MFHPKQAAKAIVTILVFVMLFHLLVLTGVVPFTIVWGGRLKTNGDMLRFEFVSIATNLLMVFVAAVKANWLRLYLPSTLIRVGLWLMAGLFLLNTIGNIFSTNRLEQIIFTPLTMLLSLLSFLAARNTGKREPAKAS